MTSEQDKTLQGLQVAIQMEIDGKEFYLKASRESANELGKKLLEKLASEEDNHRQRFEQIYNSIKERRGWPTTDFQPDGGRTVLGVTAGEEVGHALPEGAGAVVDAEGRVVDGGGEVRLTGSPVYWRM